MKFYLFRRAVLVLNRTKENLHWINYDRGRFPEVPRHLNLMI